MGTKDRIVQIVDRIAPELIELSHKIHENPELGLQEHRAAAWQAELLERHGFAVEKPFCSMETAYRAVKGTLGRGPQIAFLAEYDALQGLGHGCGHNLIAASSCGAAIALAEVLEGQEGAVILFGTPAEETLGAKIPMVEQGAFDGVDCAMMMHPSASENLVGRGGLAAMGVNVEFFGKPAHSSRPADGINALTSTIALFNGINGQLHLWPNKSKINGIITKGGDASNVIPSHCACRFTVRADKKKQLLAMYDDLVRLAQAAANQTGAKVQITHDPISAERYSNNVIDRAFLANMALLGEEMAWPDPEMMCGSSDIGNVSLAVPAVHEYLSLHAPGVAGHTPELREAARSPRADEVVTLAAKGLAMTGLDIFENPQMRQAMWQEFREKALPNRC